jgi:hypothetical protein
VLPLWHIRRSAGPVRGSGSFPTSPARQIYEVEDWHDSQALDLSHCEVGETPVVDAWANMHAMIWQSVAELAQTHLANKGKVLLPTIIVSALGQWSRRMLPCAMVGAEHSILSQTRIRCRPD